jgi:hypothetical protein
VRAKVLDIISSDPGLQQTELVFLGLFGRCLGGARRGCMGSLAPACICSVGAPACGAAAGVTLLQCVLPMRLHAPTARPCAHPAPRACRLLESPPSAADAAEAAAEAATLVELLEARVAALAATLEGAFPELRATVWQSEGSVQAAVQVGGQAGRIAREVPTCCALPSVAPSAHAPASPPSRLPTRLPASPRPLPRAWPRPARR